MEVFQSREEGREEGEWEEGEGEREGGGNKEIVKRVAAYFPGKWDRRKVE